MAGRMSRGPWNICERGFFLSRLCRESLLTSWRPMTLEGVVGEGLSSPTAASRRVRGLGRGPKVCIADCCMDVVGKSSEGQA